MRNSVAALQAADNEYFIRFDLVIDRKTSKFDTESTYTYSETYLQPRHNLFFMYCLFTRICALGPGRALQIGSAEMLAILQHFEKLRSDLKSTRINAWRMLRRKTDEKTEIFYFLV